MELILGRKKQHTCIIATTTPETFETHGYNMLIQKNQHRRCGRKAKITSGRTRLSVWEATSLIRLEHQGLGPSPNLMQDVTPTPPMFSLETTTKRPMPSSTAPTTPSSPYKKGKRSGTRHKARHHDDERQHHHHDAVLEH